MFLFEQKFSGMDSSLEKPCQNRLCEICSLTTEPLRSLQQKVFTSDYSNGSKYYQSKGSRYVTRIVEFLFCRNFV